MSNSTYPSNALESFLATKLLNSGVAFTFSGSSFNWSYDSWYIISLQNTKEIKWVLVIKSQFKLWEHLQRNEKRARGLIYKNIQAVRNNVCTVLVNSEPCWVKATTLTNSWHLFTSTKFEHTSVCAPLPIIGQLFSLILHTTRGTLPNTWFLDLRHDQMPCPAIFFWLVCLSCSAFNCIWRKIIKYACQHGPWSGC